ncbi:hypothetical protein EUX98_g8438 [Antrodiella citrinella]|uniref:Uncharacterized protein n=1 Tax=Antrodiella citrinella TaxID=2447956 RepID=A0A4V3XGF5_9APHY|nr:hypothetical protein EUX98_g8438 [Antrodiella citrinella]
MSTSVATKLRGIGVIGAVPVCDTLRVVADIRNPVPLEIEAREGRKLILAWSLHYFHETGLNIKDVLDCIFSATPAPLLARLRTVEVVVQENDIHVPEYLSLIDQVEALHLTGAQGIITEIVRQHLACTTSHDSAGNPVLQPSMTLPFPNLRFITLDNIRLSAKAVGHCDLRTALFLMCALRKNEGVEVTLVLINGR